jgi:hypothetical protein
MIVLRKCDGAPKCVLRDFLREEARPVVQKLRVSHTIRLVDAADG